MSNHSNNLLVIRQGGYGDHIYWSSVLHPLLDRYDAVSLCVDTRGAELFWNDPRIDSLYFWEPNLVPIEERDSKTFEHWDQLAKEHPDCDILNFYGAIEGSCVTWDLHPDSNLNQVDRTAKFNNGYYERHFDMAKVAMPEGWIHEPTIHFTDEEEANVLRWRDRDSGYFSLVLALAGSSLQKVFPTWMEEFCRNLIREFKMMKIYILGDKDCSREVWQCERTIDLTGKIGFKQALHMTKYADYVLGADTGLLAGAGMFGTHKTALFTLANKNQIVTHHRNDHSVQSLAGCSPCYRLATGGMHCEREPIYGQFPICTHEFDLDRIRSCISGQYEAKQ